MLEQLDNLSSGWAFALGLLAGTMIPFLALVMMAKMVQILKRKEGEEDV